MNRVTILLGCFHFSFRLVHTSRGLIISGLYLKRIIEHQGADVIEKEKMFPLENEAKKTW